MRMVYLCFFPMRWYTLYIVAFKAMLQLAILKMLGLKILLALLECFVHAIIIFFNVRQLVVVVLVAQRRAQQFVLAAVTFFRGKFSLSLSFPN